MKLDIVMCGVGGQGVLSSAFIIAAAAMKEGLEVKQSEVHGMSQRGGAVVANLRISDKPIHSDTIAKHTAAMIFSLEPLESLRYLEFLAPDGTLVTSSHPVTNIPNYPPIDDIKQQINGLPSAQLVNADDIAKEVATLRASNMVMVGAASPFLPISAKLLEEAIARQFKHKGDKIIETNLRAFQAGKKAVKSD